MRSARSLSLAIALLLGSVIPAGAQAEEKTSASTDIQEEARDLFGKGQLHYSLGEYEEAIASFRRAYELTAAPGLLFNIAQAHRLNGQCKQALEVYRHFIRLSPESTYRAEAETNVASLLVRCGAPPSSELESVDAARVRVPAVLDLKGKGASTSPNPGRWSGRRRAATALLAAGVATAAAAGGLYWWNDGRYANWEQEDRRLASGIDSGTWISDQQRNDALLQSIQRVDTVDLTMAGLSVAAILTSVVLVLAFDH